jgi:cation/acetate symporter
MVSAAFSLAASTLFPALVLGVFWKRANQQGAIAGMLIGFLVCVIYLVQTSPAFGGSAANQWFHIASVSAGVFGVPAGFTAMVIVTLLTPAPSERQLALVDQLRAP